MAAIALLCRYDVRRAFALSNFSIVTTAANTDDITVVYLLSGCERACAGVAVLTHVAAGNVRVAFYRAARTRVATDTVACYTGVIKFNRIPAFRTAVAQITL
jgi:hypothetical protein